MSTTGLVTWLRQQVSFTEECIGEIDNNGHCDWFEGLHLERKDALAQCEAHTAILSAYEPVSHYDNVDESYEHATGRAVGLGEAVRAVALAYQHRPGYREEWRP